MTSDEGNSIAEPDRKISATATASVSRSIDVAASSEAVWSRIGRFGSIADWHPVIGTCVVDERDPPVRTLVTRDGSATFVETMTAHSDAHRSYSYDFVSAPLPLSNYRATIKVVAKDATSARVIWTGSYDPDAGREAECLRTLAGIYEAGLHAIRAHFAAAG